MMRFKKFLCAILSFVCMICLGLGISVQTTNVAHGEILEANDIPETPVKEGCEFVAWVYGIDGMYTFEPTSNIGTCYYLTVRWKDKSEDVPLQDDSSSDNSDDQSSSVDRDALLAGCNESGCGGVVGSMGAIASALMLVGSYMLMKKKED